MSKDTLHALEKTIDDAVGHLREQQSLLADIDCRAYQPVLLSLLSNVLEQFYGLKAQRRMLLNKRPHKPF